MASFSVGDVVWVRMGRGDHEEPATVVELDCETDEGESGVKCKIQVSFFESIFELDAVRAMSNSRPKRRRAPPVSAAPLDRHKTAPMPVVSKKRKKVTSNEDSAGGEKKARLASPASPHFAGSKAEDCEEAAIKPAKKVVKVTKKKSVPKAAKQILREDSDSSEDKALATLKKATAEKKKVAAPKRGQAAKKKAPVKVEEQKEEVAAPKSTQAGKKKAPVKVEEQKKKVAAPKRTQVAKPKRTQVAKKKAPVKVEAQLADDDEIESDTDHPFTIEYSPTGRATCKRCDELIAKGVVRVSHVPLFRGKVRNGSSSELFRNDGELLTILPCSLVLRSIVI